MFNKFSSIGGKVLVVQLIHLTSIADGRRFQSHQVRAFLHVLKIVNVFSFLSKCAPNKTSLLTTRLDCRQAQAYLQIIFYNNSRFNK